MLLANYNIFFPYIIEPNFELIVLYKNNYSKTNKFML